jgi:threonine dehydrogenase-like Zn-dependent dehydrogenase
MKAIAITPGKGNAHLIDIEEPEIKSPDDVKLEVLEIGICGTDREEIEGGRADAPAGESTLVIGHEMLGRVVATGNAVKKVRKGDLALFTVRRPCNHCEPCHNHRNDMCSTGNYKERGIKGEHGFQAEYVLDKEEFLIPVPEEISDLGVLTEPMSVVEKAISESVKLQSARLQLTSPEKWLDGKQALVAGIGPIGLLASFILKLNGAKLFGLDIADESSPKVSILEKIGGTYINGNKVDAYKIDDNYGKMDFILEATGIAKLEFQLLDALGMNGIYVLTGIPSGERPVQIFNSTLMQRMVLLNQVMFGSVNASVQHYHMAVDDLVRSKRKWPGLIANMITGRIPYTEFGDSVSQHTGKDIKVVVEWKRHEAETMDEGSMHDEISTSHG